MFKHQFLFMMQKSTQRVLAIILGGVLVVGCEPSGEGSKSANAVWCAKPNVAIKLPATIFDSESKRGWYFAGPNFPEQKKNVPMGRFNNQLIVDLPLPVGATDVQVKVPVSVAAANASVILDTIWFSGSKEIGRSSPSIVLGSVLSGVIAATQVVPSGADRYTLIARPWRDIDGVLTVGEGEVVWCVK